MKTYLFHNGKNSYKANLHCHTTVSDGTRTPEQIKEMYKAMGYGIVAFSDHRVLRAHSYLNDEHFLAIHACEVDIPQNPPDGRFGKAKTYHFNLFAAEPGMAQTPPLPSMDYSDIDAINAYIRDRTDEGFLVSYNHPYWSLQNYSDYGGLKGCFAMEIYNHGCEKEGAYGYSPEVYDEMLRRGERLFCLSTDDNHNVHPLDGPQGDSFGGFVICNSESLSYEDVIEALRRGDFYASQGPEIHEISVGAGRVCVKCSPVSLIALIADGRERRMKYGDELREAKFQLSGSERYIRIMCRDSDKRDANSNAIWL